MSVRYHYLVLSVVIVLFFAARPAAAQEDLTADNTVLAFLGQTVTTFDAEALEPANFQGLVTQIGEGQTWNISSEAFGLVDTLESQYLAPPFDGFPGASLPAFADANVAQVIVDVLDEEQFPEPVELYFYSNVTDDVWTGLGFSGEVDFDQSGTLNSVSSVFNPGVTQIAYPAGFGSSWGSVYTSSFVVDGQAFPGGATTKIDETIIGSGTLVGPDISSEVFMIERVTEVTVAGISLGSDTEIVFNGPVVETGAAGKAALVTTSLALTLDDAGNVTGANYAILASDGEGGGGDPTSTEGADEIPDGLQLHANYPNPFNPSTSIPFSLEKTEHVALTVHDLLGRQVAELVNGVMSAGQHAVTWSADGFPSGIYQVRLESGSDVRVRTLVFQK